MENPRTETARDTDDSAMIDNLETGAAGGSMAGGNLARDIATEADLTEVAEPDANTRVRKGHTLEHGTEQRPDRARNADS
ncbi:hypothetical protein [Sphingomonas xinjiangensis]|uniref:Uncharacterized protein n=1 Tax=Sphingomonas xinjiangensis TaxID=643568 RepID=A0A840YN50_9SPHN|nr:hypothetical protein [Sphingomonas xinjiangensis]MBB5709151.1 hypothetical protein [Sphingomonas xinjiangensis]